MRKDDVRDIRWILIVLAIAFVAIAFPNFGEVISNQVRGITTPIYKERVKRYVCEQGYSQEQQEILFVAIDHIRYPQNISDYKIIYLTHADKLAGECSLVSAAGMESVIVDEKDWYVMIGDSSLHQYYNAIIDYETLEYLGSVPIA